MQELSLTRRIKQPTKMSFVTLSFALLVFNVIGAIVYLVAASPIGRYLKSGTQGSIRRQGSRLSGSLAFCQSLRSSL